MDDVRVVNEGGKVAVEEVDNGPGIPEDMLARVFDGFFRVVAALAAFASMGARADEADGPQVALKFDGQRTAPT